MARLHQLFFLILFCGVVPRLNCETTTEDTTTESNSTTTMSTELSTSDDATTSDSVTNVTMAMTTVENATTMSTLETDATSMETTTTMETSTMYIPTSPLPPITLTNCTSDDNCTVPNSICNITVGVCQCAANYVLVTENKCQQVDDFKATIRVDNVTDSSLLISWTITPDYTGVNVYYTIIFNGSIVSNVTSPHLIRNLSDGEIHSVVITSTVRGRDMRVESVNSNVEFVRTDYILCRNCGHEIIHPQHLIQMPSKLAHRQRNDTIGGRNETLIQLFKNPDGVYFEVITAAKANVTETSQSSDLMTWFPGYIWTICVCPMCLKHLGWKYQLTTTTENKPQSFYGIILANVLQESEAESIIHIPKAYTS